MRDIWGLGFWGWGFCLGLLLVGACTPKRIVEADHSVASSELRQMIQQMPVNAAQLPQNPSCEASAPQSLFDCELARQNELLGHLKLQLERMLLILQSAESRIGEPQTERLATFMQETWGAHFQKKSSTDYELQIFDRESGHSKISSPFFSLQILSDAFRTLEFLSNTPSQNFLKLAQAHENHGYDFHKITWKIRDPQSWILQSLQKKTSCVNNHPYLPRGVSHGMDFSQGTFKIQSASYHERLAGGIPDSSATTCLTEPTDSTQALIYWDSVWTPTSSKNVLMALPLSAVADTPLDGIRNFKIKNFCDRFNKDCTASPDLSTWGDSFCKEHGTLTGPWDDSTCTNFSSDSASMDFLTPTLFPSPKEFVQEIQTAPTPPQPLAERL